MTRKNCLTNRRPQLAVEAQAPTLVEIPLAEVVTTVAAEAATVEAATRIAAGPKASRISTGRAMSTLTTQTGTRTFSRTLRDKSSHTMISSESQY